MMIRGSPGSSCPSVAFMTSTGTTSSQSSGNGRSTITGTRDGLVGGVIFGICGGGAWVCGAADEQATQTDSATAPSTTTTNLFPRIGLPTYTTRFGLHHRVNEWPPQANGTPDNPRWRSRAVLSTRT